jgi:hypothetical protein
MQTIGAIGLVPGILTASWNKKYMQIRGTDIKSKVSKNIPVTGHGGP